MPSLEHRCPTKLGINLHCNSATWRMRSWVWLSASSAIQSQNMRLSSRDDREQGHTSMVSRMSAPSRTWQHLCNHPPQVWGHLLYQSICKDFGVLHWVKMTTGMDTLCLLDCHKCIPCK
jgi:hypothetical protein